MQSIYLFAPPVGTVIRHSRRLLDGFVDGITRTKSRQAVTRIETLLRIIVLALFTSSMAKAGNLEVIRSGPLDNSTRDVVVLIHGWIPRLTPLPSGYDYYVSGSPKFITLKNKLVASLPANWDMAVYHWENLAYGPDAAEAALWGEVEGSNLGGYLSSPPLTQRQLRRVHFITWSAGAWVAREAMRSLLVRNPYVIAQLTLLDPYVSATRPNIDEMNATAHFYGIERVIKMENYFSFNDFTGGFTADTFEWRSGIDVAGQQVDYNYSGSNYYYNEHEGPIQFYTDTISFATLQPPASIPAGLIGAGRPFNPTESGYFLSLPYQSSSRPQFTNQPQSQTIPSGGTVTLQSTANNATSYAWFKVGQPAVVGTSSSITFSNVTQQASYVVRASNGNGFLYSDEAKINVTSALRPAISSISPASFTIPLAGQTQTLVITGSNFPASARLMFTDQFGNTYHDRVPYNTTRTSLTYDINVGSAVGEWKVTVTGDGQESEPYPFFVVPGTSGVQLSGLSINGPASITEGGSAQFTATALFTNGTSSMVTSQSSWAENSSVTTINSNGQLNAGSVSSNTSATVTASYVSGGITKSASADIVVINSGTGGNPVTTDVIGNGGFESGVNPWAPSGYADVVNLSYPRAGSWYAYLGNTNNSAGAIAQFVPIPANATSATLEFYLNIVTQETDNTKPWDTMEINMATANDQFVGTIANFSNMDRGSNTNGNYVLKSYNIMPLVQNYRGQGMFLAFGAETDVGKSTIFRIDDVKLRITTPEPVNLTGLSISGPSTIIENGSGAYTATAVFSDGSSSIISPGSWTENSAYASIDGSGFLVSGGITTDSSFTLTATYFFNGLQMQATKSITIADSASFPTFSHIIISGPTVMDESTNSQFYAQAIMNDGSTSSISPIWSENSPSASISSSGVLSLNSVTADLPVTISATYTLGGISRNGSFYVTINNIPEPITLSSLSISGPSSLSEGESAQYLAVATYSDGSMEETDASWSENSDVTNISAFGLLSAGQVTEDLGGNITASYTEGGISRTATKDVTVMDVPDVPFIALSRSSFNITIQEGENVGTQTLTVRNSNTGTLNYSVTNGGATWMSISPPSGTSTGEADTLTISFSTGSLGVGIHTASITITDALSGNSPLSVAVTIIVNEEPFEIKTIDVPATGPITVYFQGKAGVTYRLQRSGNLQQWIDIANHTPGVNGVHSMQDVGTRLPGKAFYRVATGSADTLLFEDHFDDNLIDPTKWLITGNPTTRVEEEGGIMKVETTVTDLPGSIKTLPIQVPAGATVELTRRVLLHRDTSFYYNGDNRFFTGWVAFELGDLAAFRVGYSDYAYSDFDEATTFGFVLSKSGVGANTPPNGGLSTGALAPLILDQWFNERVVYNSATGIMTYFVNGSQLGQMNVGKPTAATGTVSLQLWFQAYGWWHTHYQHFDDMAVRLLP